MKTVTEITAEKKETSEIRLAAYCRVSSGSADQRHSFAAQQESLAEECALELPEADGIRGV